MCSSRRSASRSCPVRTAWPVRRPPERARMRRPPRRTPPPMPIVMMTAATNSAAAPRPGRPLANDAGPGVDKPIGPTSFDVVRKIRRAAGLRRVGHGGTLDPAASGILPICLGEATKVSQFLLDADKEYECVVCFGVETDTDDAAGAVTVRHDAQAVEEAAVRDALEPFRGAIAQVPPSYSALKRAGRPLYDYARAGETIAIGPRNVVVHELEMTAFD